MAILWIPGILGLTTFPNATVRTLYPSHTELRIKCHIVAMQVWGVKLMWWSIWLSVVWGGKCRYMARKCGIEELTEFLRLFRMVGCAGCVVCIISEVCHTV